MQIVDPSLLEQDYAPTKKFSEINGSPICLPGNHLYHNNHHLFTLLSCFLDGKFPYRRLLAIHARIVYKKALDMKWINDEQFEVLLIVILYSSAYFFVLS